MGSFLFSTAKTRHWDDAQYRVTAKPPNSPVGEGWASAQAILKVVPFTKIRGTLRPRSNHPNSAPRPAGPRPPRRARAHLGARAPGRRPARRLHGSGRAALGRPRLGLRHLGHRRRRRCGKAWGAAGGAAPDTALLPPRAPPRPRPAPAPPPAEAPPAARTPGTAGPRPRRDERGAAAAGPRPAPDAAAPPAAPAAGFLRAPEARARGPDRRPCAPRPCFLSTGAEVSTVEPGLPVSPARNLLRRPARAGSGFCRRE